MLHCRTIREGKRSPEGTYVTSFWLAGPASNAHQSVSILDTFSHLTELFKAFFDGSSINFNNPIRVEVTFWCNFSF